MRKKIFYTVYMNSTDEIVAHGNAEECAKQLKKKNTDAFYSLVSKSIKGVRSRYTVVKSLIEND